MSKADIWMPLYIGDYLADTTRLTTEQHGAYLLLSMDYWRNGPPPDDDEILENITKLSAKSWQKVKPIVMRFFSLQEGVWMHGKIEDQLADAAAGKAKAEEKAKKAAEARWGKHGSDDAPSNATSNAPSIPQTMHEECPLPSSSSLNTKSKTDSAPSTRLPADWEPSTADIAFCKQERPELNPASVGDQFRDYWIGVSGVKGRKADWPATWRNWVRNQRAPQARASPGYQTAQEKAKSFADRLTGNNKNEQPRTLIDINYRPA